MIEKRNIVFMIFCSLLLFWAAVFSSVAHGEDVAGSEDHPLISRTGWAVCSSTPHILWSPVIAMGHLRSRYRPGDNALF